MKYPSWSCAAHSTLRTASTGQLRSDRRRRTWCSFWCENQKAAGHQRRSLFRFFIPELPRRCRVLRKVPNAGRIVFSARDGLLAIGGDREGLHLGRVSVEAVQLLSGYGVPEPDGPVITAGDEMTAV